MKVRGKKLTRKQKEALSAQGWDFRLYLCVRDGPDFMDMVLCPDFAMLGHME